MKRLHSRDFRAYRYVLEPDDFALSDGLPDLPPTDLINAAAWQEMMAGTDDVAIRTSSYQGSRLELLHKLWGDWIESMGQLWEAWERSPSPQNEPCLEVALLDAADDFQAATFNLMHGFYKQAVGLLRSALEGTMLGAACRAHGDHARWREWESGSGRPARIMFRAEADRVAAWSESTLGPDERPGALALVNWSKELYETLCRFSHANARTANSSLWRSNGPIFVSAELSKAAKTQVETYCLLSLLAKLVNPRFKIGAAVLRQLMLRRGSARWRERLRILAVEPARSGRLSKVAGRR